MKKLSGLIMLMVLLFSVTITVSAADLVSANPFEFQIQGTIETTICQEMGGVENQILIIERMAVPAESIQPELFILNILSFYDGITDEYNINHQLKWFTHPAVLGIV